jgi:hypothetical protein
MTPKPGPAMIRLTIPTVASHIDAIASRVARAFESARARVAESPTSQRLGDLFLSADALDRVGKLDKPNSGTRLVVIWLRLLHPLAKGSFLLWRARL